MSFYYKFFKKILSLNVSSIEIHELLFRFDIINLLHVLLEIAIKSNINDYLELNHCTFFFIFSITLQFHDLFIYIELSNFFQYPRKDNWA